MSISEKLSANPLLFFQAGYHWLSVSRHPSQKSIGLQAVISVLMIVTAAYSKLLIYIGFTLSLIAMLTVIGLMRLRYKCRVEKYGYRTQCCPAPPGVHPG